MPTARNPRNPHNPRNQPPRDHSAHQPNPRRGAARIWRAPGTQGTAGGPGSTRATGTPRTPGAANAAPRPVTPRPAAGHGFQPQRSRPRPSPAAKSQSRGTVPEEFTDAARGIRLQKVLAAAGVASKRACEDMIAQGRVFVNGQAVTALPAWVDPRQDRIEVDGHLIARPPRHDSPLSKIYVMLNKPRRVLSTASDPQGRKGVTDLVDLPPDLPARVFPVGRLDADTTGLILLTNDGDLTNRLTHPRYGVSKQYLVSVRGRLNDAQVTNLREGLHLAPRKPARRGGPTAKPAALTDVKLVGHGRDRNGNERTALSITLREGQLHGIRPLLARLGYKVRRLQRIALGPLTLKGLGVGQWRLLEPGEVRALRQAAGL